MFFYIIEYEDEHGWKPDLHLFTVEPAAAKVAYCKLIHEPQVKRCRLVKLERAGESDDIMLTPVWK